MHKFWKTIGMECFDMPGMAGDGGGGGGEVAPTTTSVIEGAISGLEGNEAPVKAAEPVTKTPEEESEENELAAIEKEIREKNPQMKGAIQIHRHQAVLTRTRNQHQKAAEEWAAKEKAWQEAEAKYKADLEGWNGYDWAKDPEVIGALQLVALAGQDQRKFVETLLNDPELGGKFSELIALKDAKAVPSDRPRPNQRTEDGSLEYYDDEGLEGLLGWHGSKVAEQVKKELMAEMEKTYGGMKQAYEHSTKWNKALNDAKVELDTMRKEWKGFAENEKEIHALMSKPGNEKMSAKDAYIAYMPTILQRLEAEKVANEAAMRKKILEEMQGKKAAADGVVKPAPVEKTGEKEGEGSTRDAILKSIASLNS